MNEHMPEPAPPGWLVAYADGSGTSPERPSGCGVVVYRGEAPIVEASWYLGCGSNNHAEVGAVRVALWLTDVEQFRAFPLIIRTDSQYAIGQLTRDHVRRGAPNFDQLMATRAALKGRTVVFEHVRGHKGIPGNVRADWLAGRARKAAVVVAETRARLVKMRRI